MLPARFSLKVQRNVISYRAVHHILAAPQREVYFMGLIDVLTQYDTKKRAAHAAKAVKNGVRDINLFK